MSGHSNIGPSSAERWMACPGSVALSAGLPNPTNEHAAAGVVAHDLAYQLVTDKIDDLELMSKLGTVVMCEKHEVEIDEDMIDAVMLYRDTIVEDIEELRRQRPKGVVEHYFEQKVEFGGGVWGTADAIIFCKGYKLIVYDFKYGRGVVEAEENPQMGIYGIAAMRTIAGEAFDERELVIIQPRAGHIDGAIRRWAMPKSWAETFAKEVEAAVIETQKPNAKIEAGDHCKWCLAKKNGCPVFGAAVQKAASMSFDVVPPTENEVKAKQLRGLPTVQLMTMEKLGQAYLWREAIEAWFSDIADRIRETLESGGTVPGYKLVDGRANRKWKEGVESEIVARFAAVHGEDKLYKPRVLLGITAMEKLVGKAKKGGVGPLDAFTERPEGRKAIARDTDPRPHAATGAQDAFGVADNTVVIHGATRLPDGRATCVLPAPASDDDIFGTGDPDVEKKVQAVIEDDLMAELTGGQSEAPKKRDPMWPV